MTTLTINHIVRTPDVCGGVARIADTRIRVQDVAQWHETGASVETIAEQFELTAGQVHAALSYYYDHQQEIAADLRRSEHDAEQFLQRGQAIPSTLRQAQIRDRRTV